MAGHCSLAVDFTGLMKGREEKLFCGTQMRSFGCLSWQSVNALCPSASHLSKLIFTKYFISYLLECMGLLRESFANVSEH